MTEAELFDAIVRLSGREPRGIQPPFADFGLPIHPDQPLDYEKERSDFYESILGPLDMMHHPPLGAPHIDVSRHPPTGSRRFWCYVTNGMSDFPQVLPDGRAYRCEIIVCTRVERPNAPQQLQSFGEFPFDRRTFLAASHTIPFTPGTLPDSHPFALITPCFLLPDAHSFQLNGNTVFTISAIAITQSERSYAMASSSSALLDSLPDRFETWLLDGRIQDHDVQ